MECVLGGNQIRVIARAVQCLAKVAQSEHITFEAVPERLLLRALNLSKTAFLAISFKADFFDQYQRTTKSASCCVLVKSVLTVFRTPASNMDSLTITLDGPEAEKIRWRIECISAAPEAGNLHTQLWLDPSEELQSYHHVGEATDVTFSIKELKAFMAFCEGSEADIRMYFDKAGAPVLFVPRLGGEDTSRADFEAELIVASMIESQLRPSESSGGQPTAGTATTPRRAAGSGPSQHTGGIPGSQGPRAIPAATGGGSEAHARGDATVQDSDRTNIWSELSGSGTRSHQARAQSSAGHLAMQESADASEELPLRAATLRTAYTHADVEPSNEDHRTATPIPSRHYQPPLPESEEPQELPPDQEYHRPLSLEEQQEQQEPEQFEESPEEPSPRQDQERAAKFVPRRRPKRAGPRPRQAEPMDAEAAQLPRDNAENFLDELLGRPKEHSNNKDSYQPAEGRWNHAPTNVLPPPSEHNNAWMIHSPVDSEEEWQSLKVL
eukprot:jgi/Mesen1/2991/ME000177S02262